MRAHLVLTTLATIATLAERGAAAPPSRTARDTFVQQMELRQAARRALCPIEVQLTEDPERVPRYIKEVRCARGAEHRRACCHRHEHTYQCTELRDDVLVYYPREKRSVRETVSVGCACVQRHADMAETPPPPE